MSFTKITITPGQWTSSSNAFRSFVGSAASAVYSALKQSVSILIFSLCFISMKKRESLPRKMVREDPLRIGNIFCVSLSTGYLQHFAWRNNLAE